ncbi:MAG: GNAT family N-acetyltransferase [Methylovulum sp.]|nr:GNAT family N-acetyltransferase [Methylovulum sp.]
MTARFRIEPLSGEHNRSAFSCGVLALDRYLKEQASQDVRRRAASCYVALDNSNDSLAGYYTLSAACTPLNELPAQLTKGLPRYPSVPVALLGRLAVDATFQGCGLGATLLADATLRALRSEVAVAALVVTAKDEQAEAFYHHHHFLNFGSLPHRLILPIAGYKPSPLS